MTIAAIQFGAIAGGAVTIEALFSWLGWASSRYDVIGDKDFPILQGTFLVFSFAVIFANLIAHCLDPSSTQGCRRSDRREGKRASLR